MPSLDSRLVAHLYKAPIDPAAPSARNLPQLPSRVSRCRRTLPPTGLRGLCWGEGGSRPGIRWHRQLLVLSNKSVNSRALRRVPGSYTPAYLRNQEEGGCMILSRAYSGDLHFHSESGRFGRSRTTAYASRAWNSCSYRVVGDSRSRGTRDPATGSSDLARSHLAGSSGRRLSGTAAMGSPLVRPGGIWRGC